MVAPKNWSGSLRTGAQLSALQSVNANNQQCQASEGIISLWYYFGFLYFDLMEFKPASKFRRRFAAPGKDRGF